MDEASTSCQYNFNLTLTDWIIVYEPNRKVKNDLTNFKSLIERISNEGFNLRTKKFGKNSLVIFLHCPNKVLAIQAYKSKLDDWVHHIGDNVKKPQPITEENYNLVADTLKPAERLRLIFDILVYPSFKGGIGLQVGFNCTDFFAPHDEAFNEAWINNWNQKLLLHDEDFDIIRDNLGETVAFYFAFLQFYFKSLIIPALVGCLSFFFDLKFSVTFGVFLVTYGLVFILRWEKNEVVWATKWGTKNINKKKIHRPDFKYTELKVDPVTSEITPFYPTGKRMAKILCITLPVLILSTILVTIFVAANLAFEMYITLYYKGPYPQIVQLIPLLSYGASIPTFNAFYSSMMVGLNKFENRPTEKEFTYSLTQKVFLILSLVNFLDLIFVGFWFIPFNDVFRDYLKSFGFLVWDGQKNLNLEFGPNFLTSRLISFIITGQVLNTFLEVGLPYLISKLSASTKKLAEKEKLNEDLMDLDEEEKKFFFRVLKEYKLPKQDNFNDYAELISQFGNIVLFSICWPPTAIFCFINNFIELRSDAIKVA
ncbi:hypothetical protein HK099_005433 [Clydaea vesicula]|uniref:Anoctamin n=1 Tax=Clydaea vesicula TaxID=447962 RepID=A0AAD5XYZ0_9FUNG|nr:hypothetical protein HK099_005433 [Clydaea vesicula]